eukprot:CAMPEP_0119111654 /NCGR_PEP_ID=MMETSP1180-20130426/36627_1 /TAXON_ID=3052 ORGANISM="Chlamydomonas cf sp, Strain CCMP681" /NCGR_SAMPLE_ID=MMETSP1180 /ASSEMBLY_ACC=CAM_ASM_000741 /LENGTH=374 /DNA_ID=CAMNT_0007098741 /DNA_START=1 /DNA_END=1125 /DNA_ORIENTATION=+
MQRSRTTIQDFALSYSAYCGLKPEDLFQWLDVLCWVEAAIYQLDEDNELLAKEGTAFPELCLLGDSVVRDMLKELGLLSPEVDAELNQGEAYWTGERRLCCLMMTHQMPEPANDWVAHEEAEQEQQQDSRTAPLTGAWPNPQQAPMDVAHRVEQQQQEQQHDAGNLDSEGLPTNVQTEAEDRPAKRSKAEAQPNAEQLVEGTYSVRSPGPTDIVDASDSGPGFTLSEVLRVHEAKSFDYRVLHLLLRLLAKCAPDPDLLTFLRVDEMLVDIGDDLTDYEDDVESNSFNILRAHVHLFGREAPLKLAERISSLEEQHTQLLAGLSPEVQQHFKSRHQQASAEGQGAGDWVFPPLILHETSWRASLAEGDEQGEML